MQFNELQEKLQQIISYVKSTWNETLLITGDININMLDQQNSFKCCYKDMLEQFNLIQIVQNPTRTSRTSSAVYANVLPCSTISDHVAPYAILNVK